MSEIWHSNDNAIVYDIYIPGYTFLKTKSVTQNGGVGLYIKDSLKFHPRNDLTSCANEFETVWVEIKTRITKISLFAVFIDTLAQILIVSLFTSIIFFQNYHKISYDLSWVTSISIF